MKNGSPWRRDRLLDTTMRGTGALAAIAEMFGYIGVIMECYLYGFVRVAFLSVTVFVSTHAQTSAAGAGV